jgi:hypothetical protein
MVIFDDAAQRARTEPAAFIAPFSHPA